jgi:hypothetical protein
MNKLSHKFNLQREVSKLDVDREYTLIQPLAPGGRGTLDLLGLGSKITKVKALQIRVIGKESYVTVISNLGQHRINFSGTYSCFDESPQGLIRVDRDSRYIEFTNHSQQYPVTIEINLLAKS